MTYLDSVKTGAAANRRVSKKDPMELLVRLREAEPTAGKERIFGKWRKAIHVDDEYEQAVDLHCFNNLWTEQDRTDRKHMREKRAADQLAEIKGRDTEAVANAIQATAPILLMRLVLPLCGKRLEEATFAECRKEGGWLAKIGKMGKPDEIVGVKLTERKLKAIAP